MKQSILAIVALGAMVVAPLNSFEKNLYPSDEQSFQYRNCNYFTENQTEETYTTTAVANKKPKWRIEYTLEFKSGHLYNACHGTGELCVGTGGTGNTYPCHIPCWGEGSECTHKVTFVLEFMPTSEGDISIYEGTINTEKDGFNGNVLVMPARSVLINGELGKYINIPRQTVIIVGTPNFEYAVKGITFTDNPEYDDQ